MKRLIGWLWGFVPDPAKVWVVGAAIAAALGGIYFLFQSIEEKGYNRCESEHAAAVVESKDAARPPIIETGKAHEKIKAEVARDPGFNDPAGPRVSHAIDSLREKMGNR